VPSKPRRHQLKTALKAGTAELRTEWVIPVRWLKQIVAVFLVPLAFVLTRAFFSSFTKATIHHGFWATEEFWFFGLGSLLWLITFFGLPRPLLMYVFGHELSHVIWVWLMGGRVTKFKVSRHGGYIVTDKTNVWIALAPYFFPIYSVIVLLIYAGLSAFTDVEPYRRWVFGAVGFTWMFHVTFTIWMLWNGQTDLIEHGTFFSMMLIYLVNFVILSLMLIMASRNVTFHSFGSELLQGAMDFSDVTLRAARLKQ
jgi:hypothetical protein